MIDPHAAIEGRRGLDVLNMVSSDSVGSQGRSVEIANDVPHFRKEFMRIRRLELPARHRITLSDLDAKRVHRVFLKTFERPLQDFEHLLASPGIGPATIRALALVSQIIFGEAPSYEDPVSFSFAHGGKDGTPFPVNRKLARFEEMGFDLSQFVPALLRPPSQTFRINTLKAEREQVLKSLSYLEPEPVGWNDLVFRIKGRLKLGNLLEHFLGLIYAQDSSSTIPVTVLDPQPDEEILDMAAAPGSKATQIAAAMRNTGLLVANDVSPGRIPSLTGNLDRSGVLNTVVSGTF